MNEKRIAKTYARLPEPKRNDATQSLAPAGFFVLRSPLLPFDELAAWSEDLEAPNERDPARLPAALARDRVRLRDRLRRTLERPEVRDALFVAAPRILDEVHAAWTDDPDGKRGQKVERTLVRYFSRMCSRPTPFGLFAGCSVGTIAADSRLVLEPRERYQRHTRLGMDYVANLAEALANDPARKGAIRYRPSSGLYTAAGRLRHTESRSEGQTRTFHLVAIEPSPHLTATLERAAAAERGATAASLAQAIVTSDPDITLDEANEFIGELIQSALLVPELEPPVTGLEPLDSLIAGLHDSGTDNGVIVRLAHTKNALTALDAAGVGSPPRAYLHIAKTLNALPAPVDLARLFQVELVKPMQTATLGAHVVSEMIEALERLRRIAPYRTESALDKFRQTFTHRFEEQEVPLVFALDDEVGIGYESSDEPSPLLRGMPLGDAQAKPTPSYTMRHALLLERLEEALACGAREIVLGPEDLARIENPSPPDLPDALTMLVSLGARSTEALAAGDFRLYIERAAIPSGASLLGRFCHADPELHARVARLLREEEALLPDAIFAEIVHLPERRTGNVICRPVLRRYEIPFLGRSGAAPECQIPITDLTVSVTRREVVLRSRSLGKRVIPRLTNAHKFSTSPIGLYRFLCDVALQHAPRLGLDWGPLASAPYLPRVVSGKLVLSLETWHIDGKNLARLGKLQGSARFAAVQSLREELRLPRHVALVDGDRVLVVDLVNILAVESFVHLVKRRSSVTLQEVAPGPHELCVEGAEGRFTHELIVPFVRRAETHPAPPMTAPVATSHRMPPTQRTFLPGSEWLFAKLYTSTAVADRVICALGPVIDRALASGAVSSWFFIRYHDTDWHLRLRLHGCPARLTTEVLPSLHEAAAPLLADGRIWKLEFGTYEREIERYGGPLGVLLAERLFYVDSRAALGILSLLEGDAGTDIRWRIAFRAIDDMLDDLGIGFEDKRQLIRRSRDRLASEFQAGVPTQRALGQRYREERASLHALLDRSADGASPLAPALAVLAERSVHLREIALELAAAERSGELDRSVLDMAGTFAHMTINRLLRSAVRAQEHVIYDLLHRCYESRAARAKVGNGSLTSRDS